MFENRAWGLDERVCEKNVCVFAGVVFPFIYLYIFFHLVLLGHSQTFWLYFFKMYFFP